MSELLPWLGLTAEQERAALDRGSSLLVAAGAGTGKTRTLVARYLSMLAEEISPRDIASITFTDKAAREMRNRIRGRIIAWLRELEPGQERQKWSQWLRVMESARIGTIHSLCAEMLRAHPASAVIDPDFEVLDEGASALLREEAVDAALVAAANDPELAHLYRDFSVWGLRRALSQLLGDRLDAAETLGYLEERAREAGPAERLGERLEAFQQGQASGGPIAELRAMQAEGRIEAEATASMAAMLGNLLAAWDRFEAALEGGDELKAVQALFEARRHHMRGNVGSRGGQAKGLVESLRADYEREIDPWLGGGKSSDPPPDAEIEARYGQLQPLLERLFARAHEAYEQALTQRHALDFDGLEAGAVDLMEKAGIREQWRDKIRHVLVDEFQDTNDRQRRIVQALTGAGQGTLFVVGDAKQSIYRFRGAEVSVFRQMEEELAERKAVLELSRTFRQHRPLLAQLDELLPGVMGTADPGALYETPYRPLETEREPGPVVKPPFLEFTLGLGGSSDEGRQVASHALAHRLAEMHADGELRDWDQVALLFRASSGFAPYEDALEAHGIPYVTVAGRGFYDRPEVREALTVLRALAEPWNDAAVAGMLRSAMIGMSDPGIYRLRVDGDGIRPLRQALDAADVPLSEGDEAARARAQGIFLELAPRVDRASVYQVLKALIDVTDARAALAIAGERQWGNLDKLLEDARGSQTTRVREFLEYVRATRAAGVREGEAPAEGEGALRLMTIHKAKGLEFPVVILADAGYAGRTSSQPIYLSEAWGLTFRPDRWDGEGLAYRAARAEDQARDEAEENRLLYVAATRARDKLLVSGHLTASSHGVRALGWLSELLEAIGVEVDSLRPGSKIVKSPVHCRLSLTDELAEPSEAMGVLPEWPQDRGLPLYKPVAAQETEETDDELDLEPARGWRATARRYAPAPVVGVLVHRALERWLFPPEPALDRLLQVSALVEGLVDAGQRAAALQRARELLARFRDHPLKAEIDSCDERYHELPYTYQPQADLPDSGAFDLLYRREGSWMLLDFKTDALADEEQREKADKEHWGQLKRYSRACRALLGEDVEAAVLYLDDRGAVRRAPLSS